MTGRTYFYSIFVFFITSFLVACGGGSSTSDQNKQPEPTQPTNQTYKVTVIDGYLRAATVWLDLNGNGLKDADEPSAETANKGIAELTFSSDLTPTDYSLLAIAEAGKTFDESLNRMVDQGFVLASSKGESVITPLTTLIYIKEHELGNIDGAKAQIGIALDAVTENLFEDFIATKNTYLAEVAADLVRLSLMPETPEQLNNFGENPASIIDLIKVYSEIKNRGESGTYVMRDNQGELAGDTDFDGIADPDDSDIDGDSFLNDDDAFPYEPTEWLDLDNDGIGNNTDTDIDGDNIENEQDAFPFDVTEWEDLDNDGVGNNSDPDIDGDGILNDEDPSPYTAEFNTLLNPGTLTLTEVISGHIKINDWQYFTVNAPENVLLNIELTNLTGDADLYVAAEEFPTKFDYLCRSNESDSQSEKCVIRSEKEATYFIGVLSKQDTNFTLSASTSDIVYKKAMLLLHGLASSPDTWDSMVNDDSFFNGQCYTLTVDNDPLPALGGNSDGINCFNLEFGSLDRDTIYSASGLDNKSCGSALSCNGDYTTFEGLGIEVESAIARIVEHLGGDVEIFLFGHSRGGLAARAYLQNPNVNNKTLVKGFATTGTPHQGSPLGRFYKYMDDNCTPKSVYRQDGSKCEDNWEVIELLNGTRTYFGVIDVDDYQMELQAPSIDFLSPESDNIKTLNENIALLHSLVIGQLAYEGTRFGLLGKNVKFLFDYDLYQYQSGVGDHPHPDTLRYIENGVTRESLIGDGIVPSYSQKLSLLLEKEGIAITKAGTQSTENILHTEETSQVSDINWLFEVLYQSLEWE
ncbi:pre-peptidase C-terminal domain-containing protein [Colwellia sp. Arc7-D]|uniref:pre-peptidase C-terminal domain-containing protein n=1 Tax=Colwellia sp. Arc7-D TaxID=2161872 RepID=UPI000D37A9D4|nr:pre-peptidase C-terminal domain-containing protein [Colwellia sp. Arc7-D]AWB57096.1 peptidase [Colwellia sp. Arc7-D]